MDDFVFEHAAYNGAGPWHFQVGQQRAVGSGFTALHGFSGFAFRVDEFAPGEQAEVAAAAAASPSPSPPPPPPPPPALSPPRGVRSWRRRLGRWVRRRLARRRQ